MARNDTDALVTRNNKLEAFLRRNLDEGTFEKIRTHEACIVCSAKEDKQYKYVIVSDEWIYLTENPPKKVNPFVHLADVVNIELVNDFPEFLQGAERENTQHLAIHFLTNEPKKGRRRSSKASARTSARSGSISARSITRTASLTNAGLLSTASIKSPRRNSFDDRLLQAESLNRPSPRDALTARLGSTKLDTSLRSATWSQKPQSHSPKVAKSAPSSPRHAPITEKDSKAKKAKTKSPKGSYGDAGTPRRELPSPPSITVEDWDQSETSRELRLALDKLNENDDDNDDEEHVFSARSRAPSKAKQQNITFSPDSKTKAKPKKFGLSCFGKKRKISEEKEMTKESDMSDVEGDEEWRKDTLHLYIVNHSSPLLVLTRFAWTNYLVRATLELDDDYFRKTSSYVAKKSSGEKMNQLYNQLRAELLEPGNSMEDIFELIHELKSAAERNFILKKLFWKTSDIYAFIIAQLQKYLPESPRKLSKKEDPITARADEIEYAMLLVETLCVMLRETEVIPSRIHCIKTNGAKMFHDLLAALVCTPEMPQVSKDLLIDFTNTAINLLYELFLVTHQASMEDDQNSFLNMHHMMAVMSKLSKTEQFVGRVMEQGLALLSPSRRTRLPAAAAVLLFHQFTFINRLLQYNPKVTDYIRNNFYEEFKYYIQAPIIESKLPKMYPISSYTVKQVQSVMSVVLQRPVDLELDDFYGRYNLRVL